MRNPVGPELALPVNARSQQFLRLDIYGFATVTFVLLRPGNAPIAALGKHQKRA